VKHKSENIQDRRREKGGRFEKATIEDYKKYEKLRLKKRKMSDCRELFQKFKLCNNEFRIETHMTLLGKELFCCHKDFVYR
jgi:hypothetical protein